MKYTIIFNNATYIPEYPIKAGSYWPCSIRIAVSLQTVRMLLKHCKNEHILINHKYFKIVNV